MRVLALSNERAEGADPDIPWALSMLRSEGFVTDYQVYSTPVRVAALGEPGAALELAEIVSGMTPDAIVFFHSGSCLFADDGLELIRSACPGAIWLYREGDAFARWTLPYPRTALATARRCAAAFLFCDGYLAHLLRRSGTGLVTYAPSWVNPERFPRIWSEDASHEHDVVFIGNNVQSRMRRIPGARERVQLVSLLQRRYGSRLGLYGRGWSGPGVRGTCSLNEIPTVYSRSRVAVGIDHLVGAYQFSNRLPIALSSGVPLAHSSFEGAEQILPGLSSTQFYEVTSSALSAIDSLLQLSSTQLKALSDRERHLAEVSFRCDKILRFMLEVALCIGERGDSAQVRNPWLGDAGLLGLKQR